MRTSPGVAPCQLTASQAGGVPEIRQEPKALCGRPTPAIGAFKAFCDRAEQQSFAFRKTARGVEARLHAPSHLDARERMIGKGIALLDPPAKQCCKYGQRVGGGARREWSAERSSFHALSRPRRPDPAFARCRPSQERPVGDRIVGSQRGQRADPLDDRPSVSCVFMLASLNRIRIRPGKAEFFCEAVTGTRWPKRQPLCGYRFAKNSLS